MHALARRGVFKSFQIRKVGKFSLIDSNKIMGKGKKKKSKSQELKASEGKSNPKPVGVTEAIPKQKIEPTATLEHWDDFTETTTWNLPSTVSEPAANQDVSKNYASGSGKQFKNKEMGMWEGSNHKNNKNSEEPGNKKEGNQNKQTMWEESNKKKDNWGREFGNKSKGVNPSNFNRNYGLETAEDGYKEFWSYYKFTREKNYVKVNEIEGDLFAMPKEYSLAHCVAEDMAMGSGIAVQFSRDFKRRDELLQQREKQGGLAILEFENRFIYYLVTKRLSTGKPTMNTLWSSLQKLKNHIEEHKVTQLAMPRIGCGLDRLEWSEVKAMIEYTFRNTDINITVCNFQQPEDDSTTQAQASARPRTFTCPVKNVDYPLVQIEAYTAIVYFGSEDGYVTEEIESLDTKFKILQDYKTATKKVGEVIQSSRHQNTYILYGFIIKKTKTDLFDFIYLQKCIESFKKFNVKQNAAEYVGIQAFLDQYDDLIMSKIVNILKHGLRGVEIYVCWPGKMAPFMPTQFRRDNY